LLRDVQSLAGRSNLQTTQRYIEVDEEVSGFSLIM